MQQYLQSDKAKFIISICENLLENVPELVERLPEDGLQDMVENGINKARSYGLESDEDIAAFVTLMFEIAPNFDFQSDIRKVLTDASIAPEDKFDQLFAQVSEAAWSEAELNYDSDHWLPSVLKAARSE